MLGSMTNWLSGKSDTKDSELTNTTDDNAKESGDDKQDITSIAKGFSEYLVTLGKTATSQVTKTAIQLKDVVEEKTILGDFRREQDKFVTEKRERKKRSEAAVPPWVGYVDEDTIKQQILSLSTDKRNFMRNPPAGVQFNYDHELLNPVATVMLEEDENLKKMRFDLVPKQINEENFWRNYFYRVSLIKQSAHLSQIAQNAGSSGNGEQLNPTQSPRKTRTDSVGEETFAQSPVDHDFVSDSYQEAGALSTDERQQLGMTVKPDEDDVPAWERELQAELQEYEVVNNGKNTTATDDVEDDAELEQEILKQLEAERTT